MGDELEANAVSKPLATGSNGGAHRGSVGDTQNLAVLGVEHVERAAIERDVGGSAERRHGPADDGNHRRLGAAVGAGLAQTPLCAGHGRAIGEEQRFVVNAFGHGDGGVGGGITTGFQSRIRSGIVISRPVCSHRHVTVVRIDDACNRGGPGGG